MKNKKNLISAILLCVGLLLAVCSIFCFFGSFLQITMSFPGEGYTGTYNAYSVFIAMFGGEATIKNVSGFVIDSTYIEAVPMLTVVFVFEIIVIILFIIIVVGFITKKIKSKFVLMLICAISLLTFVGAILALSSKDASFSAFKSDEEALTTLGGGVIAYAVMGFVSVAANVTSILLNKQPKAAN